MHDAPGAAPSTTTVAVDPGTVAIVTDETFNAGTGVVEGADVGALATAVEVGALAAVDGFVVAAGLGVPDELPPHAAATTRIGMTNISAAFRNTNLRCRENLAETSGVYFAFEELSRKTRR